MTAERLKLQDSRMQGAVAEIEGLIARQFPLATFEVRPGEDPEGVYLTATVDTDDLTTVLGTIQDRLVELQVDDGVPLYVVPVRPLERVLSNLRQPKPRIRPRFDVEVITPPVR